MPSVEDLEGAGVLATAHAHLLTGPGEVALALTCADGTPQAGPPGAFARPKEGRHRLQDRHDRQRHMLTASQPGPHARPGP